MRLNIFEQMKNAEINYAEEMERINQFFSKENTVSRQRQGLFGIETYYIPIEEYIQKYLFLKWNYRGNFISVEDMRKSLNISNYDIKNNNQETLIYYFEFILNMLLFCAQYSVPINQSCLQIIKANISNVLDKLNYKSEEKEDYIIVIEKDPKAIAVAELYEDISDNIIEYRRFAIQGNIERKKEILATLSKKIEAIEAKLKQNNYSYLVDEITGLLNSLDIRHNNKEGKHAHEVVIEMSSEELESWCDKTYDTILLALMVNNYLEYKNEIKDLNKKLKTKK